MLFGRAASQAWAGGELAIEPEELRRIIESEPGVAVWRWAPSAGFLMGAEEALEQADELAG